MLTFINLTQITNKIPKMKQKKKPTTLCNRKDSTYSFAR